MNLALLAERDLRTRGPRARLWFEERSYSNIELHDASLRLAGVLSALGVRRDDRVMVLLPNCPEVLLGFPAIWRVGAVAVPALPVLGQAELEYIACDCTPKLIVTTLDQLPKLRRIAVQTLVITEGRGEPPPPALSFERALLHAEPFELVATRASDDLAVILYTSGTTGKPKGVMLSHRNLSANAEHSYESSRRKQVEDVSVLALPLAHSFGLGALVGGYLFGGRSILVRRFEPDAVLRLIERHRATLMPGVPTMFLAMLRVSEPYLTRTMQRWIVGGAPMPPAQVAAFEARFGGVMHVAYGLSEASPGVAAEREGEPRKPGSAGRPLEGVTVKIIDDTGTVMPPGELGEICVAGANVSLGYFDLPDATAATFQAGWLRTGDLGYLDQDGYLFVIERQQDLIIRGGFNVYPQDVEQVLLAHPEVLDCGVVGVPDALLGEQVCACVVRRAGSAVSGDALIAHCQATLAKYKTPTYVEFLDMLPRTPLGKIRKRELRAWALKKLAGQG
ncbi:MAG TPA: AMP-binding protein [Polyangiales bacterium]|nr:AMP-binding protein [Polyangiales bacterium]